MPLDETLAAEIRTLLGRIGWDPGRGGGTVYAPMWPAEAEPDEERPMTGEPGPLPAGWDDAWQAALVGWMAVENLEERTAAPGWIDPRVLAFLRNAVDADPCRLIHSGAPRASRRRYRRPRAFDERPRGQPGTRGHRR